MGYNLKKKVSNTSIQYCDNASDTLTEDWTPVFPCRSTITTITEEVKKPEV